MLTKEDVDKLIAVFATREEVATKTDLEKLDEQFSILQTAVDGYAKKADAYFQEMVVLANKVNRHEKWLQQIANKLGLNLEY